MMRIGRIPRSDRSPCSCSPHEPSLLILVNGSDENVRFHLPNDIEWEMIWSSAEIAGEYPGQGTQIEKLAEFDEEAEDKPAGRFRNHLQRLNTMYWQMDENAASLNSADDGLSEDGYHPVDAAGSEHQRDEADFDGDAQRTAQRIGAYINTANGPSETSGNGWAANEGDADASSATSARYVQHI